MPKIHIIDVTNRDGVQTSRVGLAKLEKTIINLKLDEMGVFQSEFGFPVTNHEVNYLNGNLELAKIGALKRMRLAGWTRAIKEDVEKAFRNVPEIKHFNISISTSEQMITGKFQGKKTREDVIKLMVEALKRAKELGAETVGVNAEDASRTDMKYLTDFSLAAKENGADRVRYCDTLGYDDPMTIHDRIKELAENVKMPIELHCHNDLGMAVANSIAGAKACIDAGQDAYINTTINGIGERAGNADMLSVLLALRKSSGFYSSYSKALQDADLKKSYNLAKYASYAFKIPIPHNQVGVGSNAFAHESGIHADGALKDRRNYELYDYEELGRGELDFFETGRQITTGEYGGIKGFIHVMDKLCEKGKFCVEFKDDNEANRILELVRFANVHTQKPLTEEELCFISMYPEIAGKIMRVVPP
ncbi:homocitrate synthase [Candidatus Woesearchaeota archaeon]|nr:homocitrate synthase [Candidatus Woesearchaeota archaeon]